MPSICTDSDVLSAIFSFLSYFIEKFSFKSDLLQKKSIELALRMVDMNEVKEYTAEISVEEKTRKFILCSLFCKNFSENLLELPSVYEDLWKVGSPWKDTFFQDYMWGETNSFSSFFPLKAEEVFPFLQEVLKRQDGFIALEKKEEKKGAFLLGFPVLSVRDEIELSLAQRIQFSSERGKNFSLLFLRLEDRVKEETDLEIGKIIRKKDAVFPLIEQKEYMIIMEDCSKREAEDIAMRIKKDFSGGLFYTIASFPLHGRNAPELLKKVYS